MYDKYSMQKLFLAGIFCPLITGGLSELGEELKVCECYNPVSETWMRLPDMHHKRAYLGLTTLEGSLYAVGEEKIETSLE